MPMVPFVTRFRDLAFRETRSVTLLQDTDVPAGQYGFIELYCDEENCDCRRVLFHVVGSASGGKIWATINYGWESPAYYEAWAGGMDIAKDMTGATLEPFGPQTPYSEAFLRLFESVVCDEEYVQRLQRHYHLFKGFPRPKSGAPPRRGNKRRGRRR